MSNARVWINGHELGGRPYGYIGFAFDLTPHLHFGAQENVLAVRLTPEDRSSRWYPGAGIYRNVWLDVTGPVHVAHWGTYVTTPEVSGDKATVAVKTEIRNQTGQEARMILQTSVLDSSGKVVSRNGDTANIPAGGTETVGSSLTVTRPQRWDMDHPYLYSLVSEVMDANKKVVDRYVTPFGIRTIAFDKDRGFLLNGRARQDSRRLRPSRPGRARRGREPPRHRAAVADPQGRGRQCHPHQPQSAIARVARVLRPAGTRGDG